MAKWCNKAIYRVHNKQQLCCPLWSPLNRLRKQLTLCNLTNSFPAKWCLGNKCRNSILITMCHHPTTLNCVVLLIGWSKFSLVAWPITMECLCSFLRHNFMRKLLVVLQNVVCFVRLKFKHNEYAMLKWLYSGAALACIIQKCYQPPLSTFL